MGLLSPFLQTYYGQQQPFGQQFGGPTPQMPQSPLAALQQPVPMPTMGAPQPAPFALNQPTAMPTLNQSPLGAGARGPTMGPKGPMQMGGANKPGGFIGRLQSGVADLPNNSLFQLGMSLLGNAQNGGNWGQVGQDMMAFADRRRQQQQEDNQTRRAKVLEGRQDTAWSEREGQAAAFNQYLAGLSPEEAARVRAIGMEGLPDYIQGQQSLEIQRANLDRQDRQFQQSLALDRERLNLDRYRVAADEARPNRSQYLRGPDRGLMEDIRSSSGSANELLAFASMFEQANARTGTGGLSQYVPFSADRASMRAIASQMRGLMRPVGSGATSDYEQRLYAQGVPSIDLLGPQNQAIINNIRALAQIRNARRYFYEDWAEEHGSLNGAERAFQQSPEFQQVVRSNPLPGERTQEAPARRASAQERPVSELSDQELMDMIRDR